MTFPPTATPPTAESDLRTRVLERLGGRNLVLVGMMGAGKSTVGKRLAERLKLRFADADAEIESAADKSIPEIFAEHGETYFREGERRVIARLLDEPALVLATGGGAFINAETRQRIAARAVSVWLKAELDVLMSRVRKRSNRPLLKTADPDATMQQLMEVRHPIYTLADVTVQSREVAHEVIVSEILEALVRLAPVPRKTSMP